MDTNPSREIMSKLAQGSYKMGDKKKSKKTRLTETQNFINETGFSVIPKYTNSEVTTYSKNDDPTNIIVAHRGTSIANRRGRDDVKTDILFAMGIGDLAPTFKRRKQRTNKIIKELEPTQFHLAGHSLGGGTVNYTIANSKIVRKNLTSARTFNAAANPIFTNDIEVTKNYKKELENKVIHNRIKNDIVSVGFKNNLPFGKLVTNKVKHDPSIGKSLLQNIADLSVGGLLKGFTEKSLHAHSISHFHDGSIKS